MAHGAGPTLTSDGRHLLAIGDLKHQQRIRDRVKLWEVETGRCVRTIADVPPGLSAVQPLLDGLHTVPNLDHGFRALAIPPDGRHAIISGGDRLQAVELFLGDKTGSRGHHPVDTRSATPTGITWAGSRRSPAGREL